ncbi:MAG TPA: 4Fe-4S binding protein [Firmicutes bacterium]|nr:4Fe-4S binding protein [Bacillota bacterium]
MVTESRVVFHEDRCKACELCVHFCPQKIIHLAPDRINAAGYHPAEVTAQEKCTSCRICALMCPDVVIEVYK